MLPDSLHEVAGSKDTEDEEDSEDVKMIYILWMGLITPLVASQIVTSLNTAKRYHIFAILAKLLHRPNIC